MAAEVSEGFAELRAQIDANMASLEAAVAATGSHGGSGGGGFGGGRIGSNESTSQSCCQIAVGALAAILQYQQAQLICFTYADGVLQVWRC
jgi:hypothetical protein